MTLSEFKRALAATKSVGAVTVSGIAVRISKREALLYAEQSGATASVGYKWLWVGGTSQDFEPILDKRAESANVANTVEERVNTK